MSSTALPLSEIVDVVVQVTGIAATAPSFNIGLITGTTVASGYAAANTRILEFVYGNWQSAMIAAGFTTSSPEYVWAELYFSQEVPPQTLYVGLQNPSSLKTVIPHSGAAGTNYTAGDVLGVTETGGTGGQVQVATVSTGGVVTGLTVVALADGTGYSTNTGQATTNITVANPAASGLEVDITAIGETPLACFAYLRNANPVWYGCASTTAEDSDHEEVAAFVQSSGTPAKYYWGSSTAAIPQSPYSSGSMDVASYMDANSYSRSVGTYSTTQGGAYPNNAAVAAAIMGVEMGLNTGLAGSYYTLMFKTVVGIAPEPLTQTQVSNIQSKNCNIVSNFANSYAFVWKGQTGRTGWFSDLVTFLDIMTAQLQYNLMNVLVSLPAVPMDNAGEQMLIHAVNGTCDNMVAVGFIQPGTWEGATIQLTPNVGIIPGTALTNGYTAFAAPFSTQSAAAQAARQAMPIYVCILATGAIQSVSIYVDVQA
jgi:hypothetical protein